MPKKATRVRKRLLVLLWLWAGCVFLVVDLFWNVDEFDGIRPRADIYRATRYVAHRMVGEPWRDGALVQPTPVWPSAPGAGFPLGERMRTAGETSDPALLAEIARRDLDPRVRACALRQLARVQGSAARPVLREVVSDEAELAKVRTEAARVLGLTGGDACAELEALAHEGNPTCVRKGAVAGLAGIDRAEAIARVLALAREPALTDAAAAVVRASRSALHLPVLADAAADPTTPAAVRAAACAALARADEAPGALTLLVADEQAPDQVRAAAARALGSIGDPGALPALDEAAGRTGSPAWAREVRRARARLATAE
jgi:HEAT repeat protein